jgi:ribosomal protein S18 acetylase RimI-like enzyme
MMTWSVRRATAADAPTIIEFNCRMAAETEGKTLDQALIGPGVQAALADPHKGLYFVADDAHGQIAGQMMITYEWSDWRNGWIWWIQSVYVRDDCRRQGVFRSLYQNVYRMARETPGVIGLRLYVDEENTQAQETYYRLGMVRSNYLVLEKYPL